MSISCLSVSADYVVNLSCLLLSNLDLDQRSGLFISFLYFFEGAEKKSGDSSLDEEQGIFVGLIGAGVVVPVLVNIAESGIL